MKKLLTAAFSAALLFMAGCADSDTGAVKDTTESFLKAEHEGNLDEATKYLTGDATDMFESREDMRADLKGYEDQGVSNETLDQFVDAQIKAYTMVWEDSKIDDVQVGDDTATVLVTTKGIGMKDWENMTTSGLSAEVGSQWMDDNMSRIEEYKSSHTEEEYMAWYLDQVVPVYAQELVSRLDAEPRQTTNYRFSLEKTDDGWKISNVEIGTLEESEDK